MKPQSETLRIMPREMRLMSKRILSLTSLPPGFALMLGDVVMYSQAMGLGGFALFERRFDDLIKADPTTIRLVSQTAYELVLDGGGQHAWIVVASALDLLEEALVTPVETLPAPPAVSVEFNNVLDPEELGIAVGFGGRSGLAVDHRGTRLTGRMAGHASDPVLERILQEGCQIEADLWWRTFELAQSSLTPESAISLRHAGPVMVTAEGEVIGRRDNDDDTDVNFISSPEMVATGELEADGTQP